MYNRNNHKQFTTKAFNSRWITTGITCLTTLCVLGPITTQATRSLHTNININIGSRLHNSCQRQFPLHTLEKVKISVGHKNFWVWVLDTPAKQQEGWKHIQSHQVGVDEGMLFVYPDDLSRTIYMPDDHFNISLDVAFLPKNKIVRSTAHLDAHGCHRSCTASARYVLTLRKGTFARHGIRPGAQIVIPKRLRTAYHQDNCTPCYTSSSCSSSYYNSLPPKYDRRRIHRLQDLQRVTVTVGGRTYRVRVLDTLEKRSEGANNLSEYDFGYNEGLLLVYRNETTEGFMKPVSGGNPLPDLVFIGADHRVSGTYTLHDRTNQTATQVSAKVNYVLMLKKDAIRNGDFASGNNVYIPANVWAKS